MSQVHLEGLVQERRTGNYIAKALDVRFLALAHQFLAFNNASSMHQPDIIKIPNNQYLNFYNECSWMNVLSLFFFTLELLYVTGHLHASAAIMRTNCKISNIRHTKSQNLKDYLVLQFSLPNPLKPGIKSRMKM